MTADLNFDPEFENEFGDPPRRRSALATVAWSLVAATFIGLLSAGGWFAYTQNEAAAKLFRQLSGAAATRSEPAIVSAPRDQARFPAAQTSTTRPENAAGPQPAARPDAGTVATATPAAQITPAPPPPKPPMALLTTQLWQQLETHFPDWSSKVAADVSRQREEQKDDAAIGAEVIQALVRLRRNNATAALSAPPRHLTAIAQGFVDNLRFLRQSSIEACYGFIAEGEMNSAVLPLLIEPAQSGPLPKQSIAIVQAIAASRTEPTKYAEPTKADFDALSRELVKRGWSRDDLRLFSDPAALSKAQHDQVCRLVLEWFETQISLPDGAQKLRLLNASLSPVVAG